VQAFSLSPGATRERGGRRRVVGGGVGHAMVMMMMMLARRSCSSLPWTQKSQLQLSSNLDLLQRHCCYQNQNQNKFLQPKTPRNQSKSLTLTISFGWIRHYMHLLLHSLTLNPKSPAEKPPPIAHHKHIDDLLLLLLLLLSSSSSSSSNHSCEFNNNNKKRKILKHQTGTPLSSSSSSTKHQISSQNQISISQSNFLLTSPNLHARIITSNLNLIWGASKFRYKFVKFSILSWWVLK
jgi:hypothetical protein